MNNKQLVGSNSMTIISESERLDYREVVYIYYQDPLRNGDFTLNVDFSMESDTGESIDGTCIANLKDVLVAFGRQDFDDLKDYLVIKYRDNEDAWNTIIEDFKARGISLVYDESN